MQLPYRKALLWLFLEGRGEREVREQLDELSLPIPEPEDLVAYREEAGEIPIPPGTKRRLERKHFDPQDYKIFTRLGFGEIYLRHMNRWDQIPLLKEQWEEVGRILRNPVLRNALDCGILCKYALEELAQVAAPVYSEALTPDGLDLYSRYFFNYQNMGKGDWRAYLKLCSQIPYTYIRYHAALTKPRDEALYLVGLPTKAAFSDFLKTVLTTAAFKFQYYSRHNIPSSDAQARQWAKVGFDAGVRYEKFSASDVTDFSKAVQTEFEYVETDIPTIQTEMLTQVKPPDTSVENAKKLAEPPPLHQPETEV